jgi:wobble nucleotide-excising tRNase
MNEKEHYVTEEVCGERQKNAADRFCRGRERLDKVEVTNEDLKQITVRLDTLIEKQAQQIENHEERIEVLEKRPSQLWDRLVYAIIGAVCSGLVGFLMSGFPH